MEGEAQVRHASKNIVCICSWATPLLSQLARLNFPLNKVLGLCFRENSACLVCGSEKVEYGMAERTLVSSSAFTSYLDIDLRMVGCYLLIAIPYYWGSHMAYNLSVSPTYTSRAPGLQPQNIILPITTWIGLLI